MATIAALGKTCAKPAISAALFSQDHFYTRMARFSTRLYFHDQAGKTLAFVRNASFGWNKEIRIFTDAGLSFELLAIKRLPSRRSSQAFEITDSINHERVGTITHSTAKSFEKRHWMLRNPSGQEIGDVSEDSRLRALIRRKVTDFIPQSYAIGVAESTAGEIFEKSNFSSHRLEIDISGDTESKLDRRLLAALLVLLQVRFSQDDRQ